MGTRAATLLVVCDKHTRSLPAHLRGCPARLVALLELEGFCRWGAPQRVWQVQLGRAAYVRRRIASCRVCAGEGALRSACAGALRCACTQVLECAEDLKCAACCLHEARPSSPTALPCRALPCRKPILCTLAARRSPGQRGSRASCLARTCALCTCCLAWLQPCLAQRHPGGSGSRASCQARTCSLVAAPVRRGVDALGGFALGRVC